VSRGARWTLVAFILLFVWMTLAGWETDSPRARLIAGLFSAFMLVLALGVAAPSRFLIAIRIVAGTVAIVYLLYFLVELSALLRGEQQHFQKGRPSALMAGLGLLIYGVPAIIFALGTERVGIARFFGSRDAVPEDDDRAV
jgi:hypothetical protein